MAYVPAGRPGKAKVPASSVSAESELFSMTTCARGTGTGAVVVELITTTPLSSPGAEVRSTVKVQ